MKTALLLAAFAIAGSVQDTVPPSTDLREALINALEPPPRVKKPPDSMTIPTGYIHSSSVNFEGNLSGEIRKPGGLFIKYSDYGKLYSTESPVDRSQYREYVEETINGRLLWRGFRSGRYEVNFEQCRTPDKTYVVHFSATIKDSADAADMITFARSMATRESGTGCDLFFPDRLPGYNHDLSIDESEYKYVGNMIRPGLSIEYRMPLFPYDRRVPPDKAQFREFVEETINGHQLWRGFHDEQYEVNVDVCRETRRSHILRFRTAVQESSQAAEMVAIARSLVESDRQRIDGCVSID
jgi:hypothetical protein